jgi:hypothetical protein
MLNSVASELASADVGVAGDLAGRLVGADVGIAARLQNHLIRQCLSEVALPLHQEPNAMMKTLAILLFSALALAGCATDPDVDTEIEKPAKIDPIDPAIKAWADQFVNEPRPIAPHPAIGEWAEELLLGEHLYTLIRGKAADRLYDAFGNWVLTIPCHVCDREL